MVAVEKITPSLFPKIYRSFLAEDDPDLREDVFAVAERLGLPLPVAARIESLYKRSHGIA